MKIALKLGDIDAYELAAALRKERSRWLNAAQEEGRPNTQAEGITICVLAALEQVVGMAANASDPEFGYAGAANPKP